MEEESDLEETSFGKNSLPQLADRGNPAISEQPERKGRWAVSLHILSFPLHPSSSLFFLHTDSEVQLLLHFYASLSYFVLSHLVDFVSQTTPCSTCFSPFALFLSLSHDVLDDLTNARLQPPAGSFHYSRPDASNWPSYGVTTDGQTALAIQFYSDLDAYCGFEIRTGGRGNEYWSVAAYCKHRKLFWVCIFNECIID